MNDKKTYWATLPSDEIASEIVDRVDKYMKFLESSGLLAIYRKSYNAYFGGTPNDYFQNSSSVGSAGEQGELSMLTVNHYRNLIQHLLVMTTSSRPALNSQASNTDMKSKAQTILANGILDYYMRDKRLERFWKTACEHSLVLGEGYVDMEWDTSLGQQYGVDPASSRVVKEGDIKYTNPIGPLDVVRDIHSKEYSVSSWKIVLYTANKFDLAAKYPELADKILATSTSLAEQTRWSVGGTMGMGTGDLVTVKKLYHPMTDSVPNGRLTLVLDSDTVLFDGPLPYTNLPQGVPLYRIVPGDFVGTPFGYASSWDILGLSDVHNSLYSTVVTNQTSFGVQNVTVPKGHDVSYQQLTGGLNLIEYDSKLGKPESLNLTHTPPEIFSFIEKIEKTESLLMGINDVVRGDPQASLKSGSALALVASQSIQFNSGLQASYISLLEDVGTATIRMLQTFANTKRVASIAGKSKRFMLKEFSNDDIAQINRVVIDVTNPLSRTVSGRLEMAKDLLQIPGLIKHPDQYFQVISTGTYEPLIQDQETELLTIDSENEMMQDGENPPVMITDDHALHVREHKAVVSMPDSRNDPRVLKAATDHIQQHINLLTTTDPRVLILTGQTPLPPPPQPGPPPPQGGPGAPPPQGPPPHQQHPPMNNMPNHAPGPTLNPAAGTIGEQAGNVKPPNMPTNPLTKQPFNNATGGLPQK
jgi:hypothetical protein